MKTFFVEIVAPNKVLFEGEIVRLTVTAYDGGMEVLAMHIPALCAINAGQCEITLPDNTKKVFISNDGILNIGRKNTILTSDILEWEEDFESFLSEREKYMESEASRRHESYKQYKLSSVALKRALTNIITHKKPRI
jgi:F-type H+-transporting ATPase subunit epsilon